MRLRVGLKFGVQVDVEVEVGVDVVVAAEEKVEAEVEVEGPCIFSLTFWVKLMFMTSLGLRLRVKWKFSLRLILGLSSRLEYMLSFRF